MRHLKTILTLVAILSLSTGKAQFWYPTFFSWDFENSIKVQDSVYLTGFGTLNDTMRLFGTSTSGVGVDYDSLTVDNIGGAGLKIHLLNGRPFASGISCIKITSENSLGYLDIERGVQAAIRFRNESTDATEWTITSDGTQLEITDVAEDKEFNVTASGVTIGTVYDGQIAMGFGPAGYDIGFQADTIHYATLDGTGDVIKLSATGEGTKGKLYYSMGPLPNDAVATGATEYVGVYGSSNFNNTADRFRFYMPHDGEFSDLRIYMRTAQPATGNVVATLYKNGSPTSVTVTIAASDPAGVYSDLVNSVSFVAGDYFYIQFANSASSSSGQFSGISLKTAMDAE